MLLYDNVDVKRMREACLLCDNSTLEVKTGCLIVRNHRVVASGWNESKDKHSEIMCLDSILDKKLAEESTLYVTRFPCNDCAKELINKGIHKIYFMSDHFTSNNSALILFEEARIPVIQIPEEAVWKE